MSEQPSDEDIEVIGEMFGNWLKYPARDVAETLRTRLGPNPSTETMIKIGKAMKRHQGDESA